MNIKVMNFFYMEKAKTDFLSFSSVLLLGKHFYLLKAMF
jgi:hypothetical protein